MEDNKEKNEIFVEDFDMAKVLNDVLKKSGKRDLEIARKSARNFSKEELSSIKELSLEKARFRDISALKYCTNLKGLKIKSVNAPEFETNYKYLTENDIIYKYDRLSVSIEDYSIIENIESLEFLEIGYDHNLEKLDISNLKNLYSLKLYQNENLEEVKGIEDSEIGELTLYRNNLSHSIDMEKIIEDRPCNFKLDFDMYKEIKKNFPDILEKIDKYKMNDRIKWCENVSDLLTNELNTYRMNAMEEKTKDIIKEIIRPYYNDTQKVIAVYEYITKNVKYDYESLAAAKYGEKNEEYYKAANSLEEKMETYLLRRQSSYNATLRNKSVCEGYSNMMHYLLNAVGVESRAIGCAAMPGERLAGKNINHSSIKTKIEDNWYYFDPTYDAVNKGNSWKYFYLPKEQFNKRHTLSITEKDVDSPSKRPYSNEEMRKYKNDIITEMENRKHSKYERPISRRLNTTLSEYREQYQNQDINKPHENMIYSNLVDIDNNLFKAQMGNMQLNDEQYIKKIIDHFADQYSRNTSEDRKDFIRDFATLEINGKFDEFKNPYNEYWYMDTDDSRWLVDLEKVKGIEISSEEIDDTKKDMSIKEETYIATYEVEAWDDTLKTMVWKPMKEYYKKNEEGQLEKIGTGTYEKTTFSIDGEDIKIENDNIKKDETIDRIEQKYMANKLMKNGIEDSMENIEVKGKIKSVSEITDTVFLEDFAKQCELEDIYSLRGRTYIISTINEKGEEDFDIIVRNNNDTKTPYEHLKGVYKDVITKEKVDIQSRYDLKNGDIITEMQGDTLNEFVTQSGNRYVLTNIGGSIQFSEIYRENEKQMKADLIDTYSYKQELYDAYEDMDINKEDIDRAYDVLNRTREERELYNSDKDKDKEQEDQELKEQE